MKTLLMTMLLLLGFISASAQREQAPIERKEFNYKNWTYKNVRGNGEINLRDFAKNKKLLLIVYFAPWCPNWKYEAPFAQKMYEKYRANGFDVVGVGEYDTVEAMKTNLDALKITFPVVYESDSLAAKQKTAHYEYRKAVGDTRNWGSPWNIFVEAANVQAKGDVLVKKAAIVNGELIEAETEKYIREKLGLTEATATSAAASDAQIAASKTVEACEPEKKISSLKKP